MAKVIESLKRNYPFLAAVLVIAMWHTQMELNHDGIWFRMQLDLMSYAEFIAERYQGWSSRVFVETGLLFFSRHMAAWRVVDTAMWGFLLYGLVKFLDDKYSAPYAGVVCLLFACYQVVDLNSAGWIASIMNYLWPFTCFCGLLLILKKLFQGQGIKWQEGALGMALALLACNHEQIAAAALGGLACCIAYLIWKKREVSKWLWVYSIEVVASLIFILTCPGNKVRKAAEISLYFEEFPELTLWNKLDMGVTSLCHYCLFEKNYIFLIFLLLLCIAVWKGHAAMWKKCAAFILPIGGWLFGYLLRFVKAIIPGISNLWNPVGKSGTYSPGNPWSVATLIFYALIFITVLWELLLILKEDEASGIGLLAVLGIGFGTRFMMCFSPSIWSSGNRTFMFWQMALIIASGYLWKHYLNSSDRKKMAVVVVLLAAISLRANTRSVFLS